MIDGLGKLGVLGMAAPVEFGGRASRSGLLPDHGDVRRPVCLHVGLRQRASFDRRASVVLFGTTEQKVRWLPPLASGQKLAAFALTSRRPARTAATSRPGGALRGGETYLLNGQKRYITNGAIAGVLTVMARPRTRAGKTERHRLPGHARHAGLRGGRGADGKARHPRDGHREAGVSRYAGPAGEDARASGQGAEGRPDRAGLRAHDLLCELRRGRLKTWVAAAIGHAARRHQFGRPLGALELIKKKIAYMAARAYAMEATTRRRPR